VKAMLKQKLKEIKKQIQKHSDLSLQMLMLKD
jgi:hypothetical protein